MKNRKLVIIIGIIVLLAIAAVSLFFVVNNKDKKGDKETTKVETTASANMDTSETTTVTEETIEDLEIPETDKNGNITVEKATKKNNQTKEEKTTNYWDDIEVVEDGGDIKPLLDENGETVTNQDGDVVMEDYPGQNDGWSPIVRPEDLE